MKSLWANDTQRPVCEPFRDGVKTQVLVIGGGMAGILCAYKLKCAGIDCVVVEADRIANGVTANTTAKITVQHGLIYHKIMRKYGAEAARMYLKAQRDALQDYDALCHDMDCDYQLQDAYVYTTDDPAAIEREAVAYAFIGLKAEFCKNVSVPVKIKGALRIANQAQFHPLKFCFSLAEQLTVYENTKVLRLFPGGAVTNRGSIYAENTIVATHFPFLNLYGGYFLKMYQHRSYVLALKDVPVPNGMYVDAAIGGLSFRGYGDTLLLGGGSHRTGKKGGAWQELRRFADAHYSTYQEVTHWATQDCMTLDGIPYIGRYSERLPNVYVAAGFNKWGMTSSMVAANLLTDMIEGREKDYAFVFSPSRSIWHPQLAINMTESFVNILTPTVPRCPHMGCALKYNRNEHSWDCPCHGSRFGLDGTLIENPATDDKNL